MKLAMKEIKFIYSVRVSSLFRGVSVVSDQKNNNCIFMGQNRDF